MNDYKILNTFTLITNNEKDRPIENHLVENLTEYLDKLREASN